MGIPTNTPLDILLSLIIIILFLGVCIIVVVSLGFMSWQRLTIFKLRRKNDLLCLNQANMSSLILIPIDKLTISKKKLGSGQFSEVFMGKYITDEGKINVAVKNIKDVNEQELIKEAGRVRSGDIRRPTL